MFGGGLASDVVELVEMGSLTSLGIDAVAMVRKGRGALGTTNRYASGFNMVGRTLARSIGRKDLVRSVTKVGDMLTPALALTGAFTLAYNTTIGAQCLMGGLE